jgi:hypothetical protein
MPTSRCDCSLWELYAYAAWLCLINVLLVCFRKPSCQHHPLGCVRCLVLHTDSVAPLS